MPSRLNINIVRYSPHSYINNAPIPLLHAPVSPGQYQLPLQRQCPSSPGDTEGGGRTPGKGEVTVPSAAGSAPEDDTPVGPSRTAKYSTEQPRKSGTQ